MKIKILREWGIGAVNFEGRLRIVNDQRSIPEKASLHGALGGRTPGMLYRTCFTKVS